MYQGYYINLDRSAGRRDRMERQLARIGHPGRYRRCAAIDAQTTDLPDLRGLRKGELACFISHYKAIEEGAATGQHLHIVEDDAIFPDDIVDRVEMVIGTPAFDACDLFFTETIIPLSAEYLREYQRLYKEGTRHPGTIDFSAVAAKGMYRASASSYIVNRNSVGKLSDLVGAELNAGPRCPYDLFLRTLIESDRLRAAIIVPFITAVELEDAIDTTIAERAQEHDTIRAMTLLRSLFYKDCDAGLLLADVQKSLAADDGVREQAIAHLMKFGVFGNYKAF